MERDDGDGYQDYDRDDDNKADETGDSKARTLVALVTPSQWNVDLLQTTRAFVQFELNYIIYTNEI